MFKKILYPTDFSDVSKKALTYIKQLNSAGAAQVVILRIINEKKAERISQGVAWVGMDVGDFLEQTYEKLTDEACEQIKSVETDLREAGFDTKSMVERGDPYSRILKVAENEDVSIIILGSHGRSNLSSVLLGSVSDHVIRHAKNRSLLSKGTEQQPYRHAVWPNSPPNRGRWPLWWSLLIFYKWFTGFGMSARR